MRRLREQRYHGWKNWETWEVYILLTNTRELYREAVELAKEDDGELLLKEWVEESLLNCVRGGERAFELMLEDIIDWFVGKVDWKEIVEALREE